MDSVLGRAFFAGGASVTAATMQVPGGFTSVLVKLRQIEPGSSLRLRKRVVFEVLAAFFCMRLG